MTGEGRFPLLLICVPGQKTLSGNSSQLLLYLCVCIYARANTPGCTNHQYQHQHALIRRSVSNTGDIPFLISFFFPVVYVTYQRRESQQ